MNKKGADMTIGKQVLSMVIALLVIFLLLFLGQKLISFWLTYNELENAQANLDLIVEKIKLVKDGEFNEQTVLVTFPVDWYLRSVKRSENPEICDFITCLCICDTLACDGYMDCENFNYDVEVDHVLGSEGILDAVQLEFIKDLHALKIEESVINMRIYEYGETIRVEALER